MIMDGFGYHSGTFTAGAYTAQAAMEGRRDNFNLVLKRRQGQVQLPAISFEEPGMANRAL